MDSRKELGDAGERLAAEFLVGKGYRIIERQYRTKLGEIDLVARDQDEIVFVEVKTRRDKSFGDPEEAVHGLKLTHMARAGEAYLRDKKSESMPHRYDVVAIHWPEEDEPEIIHLEAV